MIVRFMASSDLLFTDSCHELSVTLDTAGDGSRWRLVLEDAAHVMEEAGGSQHD